ncbi:MAG: aminoacyl-tRNA deacylase [Candidatus Hodarchaeales archaeon]|jgi:prolyl-tRNA editing enzyme YbaK/EbsC (Cys-tRNA(Pro) deacylase)
MNNLEKYLEENSILDRNIEIISFSGSTHTSKEAAKILETDLSNIVKTIIIMMGDESYLTILPGNKKLRQRALRKVVKNNFGKIYRDSRLANSEEVLNLTGYEIGAVPPIGLNFPVIIDSSIPQKTIVYAGGGTTSSVLKISVEKLLELTNPTIADIGREIE